jgi:hypothetical protein
MKTNNICEIKVGGTKLVAVLRVPHIQIHLCGGILF